MATITWNPGVSPDNPQVKLDVVQKSQSASANTSTLEYTLTLIRPGEIKLATEPRPYSIIIDGKTVANGTYVIAGVGNRVITSGTTTVPHNSDGKKTVSFSFSMEISVTWGGTRIGNASASGSMALTAITRGVGLSVNVTEQNIGYSVIVSHSTPAGFTSEVDAYPANGKAIATVKSKTTNTASTTWTIPTSWASHYPSDKSFVCWFRAKTFDSSGKQISTDFKSVKVNLPNSPAVGGSISRSPVGSIYQNLTEVTITTDFTASRGSSISKVDIRVKYANGEIDKFSNNFATFIPRYAGTMTVTATATDLRGYTGSSGTLSISVLSYSKPVISKFEAFRSNSSGTPDPIGSYITVNYSTRMYRSTSSRSVIIRSKLSTSSAWTTRSTGTLESYDDKVVTFSATTTRLYDVDITVSDGYSTTTRSLRVGTAIVPISFNSNNLGITIGGTGSNTTGLNLVNTPYRYNGYEIPIPISFDVYENDYCIRFSNGVMIQWGIFTYLSGYSTMTVNFVNTFSGNTTTFPPIITLGVRNNGGVFGTGSVTTSSFALFGRRSTDGGVISSNADISYQAIGRWK